MAAVAACLIVAFTRCAAVGALLGGGVGTLAGPAGTVGGAVVGAEVGDLVGGRKEAEAEIKQLRSEVIDLRATIDANKQIDDYNVKLPPGFRPVPHVTPPAEPSESHWIRTALIALVCLLGVGAAWLFRARLLAWAKRLPDLIRGRAPSAPQVPTAPPARTPLNPNP
jgi:hypothetical protein